MLVVLTAYHHGKLITIKRESERKISTKEEEERKRESCIIIYHLVLITNIDLRKKRVRNFKENRKINSKI